MWKKISQERNLLACILFPPLQLCQDNLGLGFTVEACLPFKNCEMDYKSRDSLVSLFTALILFADCTTVYRMGKKESGLYCIDINIKGPVNVFCDMATDGGGWTVIQRRKDGSVDFHRNWANYKLGFGNLTGEFWLGNDKIHELTSNGNTELRVELEDWDGNTAYAKYGIFKVADESKKYKLTVGSYSGTAGDALTTYHNGNPFTTRDRDNDKHSSKNCANIRPGAWWFVACLESHLNGQFSQKTVKLNGIVWKEWKKNTFSLKTSQMMIRRPSTVD